jgi:hypothetical protein
VPRDQTANEKREGYQGETGLARVFHGWIFNLQQVVQVVA